MKKVKNILKLIFFKRSENKGEGDGIAKVDCTQYLPYRRST
jgi:hypothetical protein